MPTKNDGVMIILSSPSGAGKTTLVKALLSENLPLSFSISATSRKPRGDEVNGVDYFFFKDPEFKKLIKNEAFIEYEEALEVFPDLEVLNVNNLEDND